MRERWMPWLVGQSLRGLGLEEKSSTWIDLSKVDASSPESLWASDS
jgi:hypothetical protein